MTAYMKSAHMQSPGALGCRSTCSPFCMPRPRTSTRSAPTRRYSSCQKLDREPRGCRCQATEESSSQSPSPVLLGSTVFWLLSQLPAGAAEDAVDFSKGSFAKESYYVTLGLFLISLPGELLQDFRNNILQIQLGSKEVGNCKSDVYGFIAHVAIGCSSLQYNL